LAHWAGKNLCQEGCVGGAKEREELDQPSPELLLPCQAGHHCPGVVGGAWSHREVSVLPPVVIELLCLYSTGEKVVGVMGRWWLWSWGDGCGHWETVVVVMRRWLWSWGDGCGHGEMVVVVMGRWWLWSWGLHQMLESVTG